MLNWTAERFFRRRPSKISFWYFNVKLECGFILYGRDLQSSLVIYRRLPSCHESTLPQSTESRYLQLASELPLYHLNMCCSHYEILEIGGRHLCVSRYNFALRNNPRGTAHWSEIGILPSAPSIRNCLPQRRKCRNLMKGLEFESLWQPRSLQRPEVESAPTQSSVSLPLSDFAWLGFLRQHVSLAWRLLPASASEPASVVFAPLRPSVDEAEVSRFWAHRGRKSEEKDFFDNECTVIKAY